MMPLFAKVEMHMLQHQPFPAGRMIGPMGEPLTLESLPPAATRRWVARRKAEVVAAVDTGLITLDEACARYSLSPEEFADWKHAIRCAGVPGLRVTRIQHYRSIFEKQSA
jgi:hypothetical protein